MRCLGLLTALAVASCWSGEARAADVSACNAPAVRIPDPGDFAGGGVLTDTVIVDVGFTIEAVTVDVDVKHSSINDLFIGVESPAGTFVQLFSGTDLDDPGSVVLVTFSDGGAGYGDEAWDCACEVMPSGPGTLADFIGESGEGKWLLSIEDVVPFMDGTLNEWCVNLRGCDLIPPGELTCESAGDDVHLTWSNAGSPTTQHVLRDGEEIATVDGFATEYVDEDLALGYYTYQIVGEDEDAGCKAAGAPCGAMLGAVGTCVELTSGNTIDFSADPVFSSLEFPEDLLVADALVQVAITHTFIGDLVISITAPDESTVTLFDTFDSDEADMHLTFADAGADFAETGANCGCFVRPSGPGALADFAGISSAGKWTLVVEDVFDEDSGKLNEWCLFVIGEKDDPPGAEFLRGDVNGDGSFGALADSITLLGYAFLGNEAPGCLEAADADANGELSGLGDTLYLLRYGFAGGDPPPTPFPACGEAPEELLGCESPPACP